MPSEIPIDTSSLLTILGLIAAVWAIIPTAARLQFKLSVTWFDWLVVISVFLASHYLVFEQSLRSIGLYYSFGPWRWGLDKGAAVYLLLLGLGIYISLRARAPKVARRNIEDFGKLADNFLLTKRYDELVGLVEPQLSKLFKITRHRPFLARLIAKMAPQPVFGINSLLRGTQQEQKSRIWRWFQSSLSTLEMALSKRDHSANQAQDLLRGLLNSQPLVTYLAVAHPSLCLKILGQPGVAREDFAELFMEALIADSSSRLYVELKNNQNLNGRHRLALPASNRILCFFFKDVSTAVSFGLYRSIGEPVCRRLDDDPKLAESYNRPLSNYTEVGKNRCPIYAGIKLFEIMVHEGIHQGQQDHLWLFYFTHFTDKILKQLRDVSPGDENYEFPTPFHFLLYQIVSITSNWIDDCIEVNESSISDNVRQMKHFDINYIPKQAADALGTIVREIIRSPKIDLGFKSYVLEISLSSLKRIQGNSRGTLVAQELTKSMIHGVNLPTNIGDRRELRQLFDRLDHVLRNDVPRFDEALKESMS